MSKHCAMCGESIIEPYGRYTLPPVCLYLMQNAEEVDIDSVAGKVRVHLCEECTEKARSMALEKETTPLTECDATATSWESAGMVEALAGGDDITTDEKRLTKRMANSALTTVKADLDGESEHILDSKVTEARVTLLSLNELGVIDTNLLD